MPRFPPPSIRFPGPAGRPGERFVAGSESGVIHERVRSRACFSGASKCTEKTSTCDAPRDGSEADALRWPLRKRRVRRPRWIKCASRASSRRPVEFGAFGQSATRLVAHKWRTKPRRWLLAIRTRHLRHFAGHSPRGNRPCVLKHVIRHVPPFRGFSQRLLRYVSPKINDKTCARTQFIYSQRVPSSARRRMAQFEWRE